MSNQGSLLMKQMVGLIFAILVLTLIVLAVVGFMGDATRPVGWISLALLATMPFLYRKFAERRYLVWDPSLSVGVEALDNDHKRLVQLINNFQTAAVYKTDELFVSEALEALVDYTKTHFGREEEMMRQAGYPDFEAHQRQHQQMIDKVNEVVGRYRKDPDGTLEELLQFLKAWLMNHIAGTDRQYGPFLNQKGIR